MTNILTTVKTGATLMLHRGGLKIKKYSPELLLGIGIVCIVGGTVAACASTLKLDDVLDDHEEKMEDILSAHDGDCDEAEHKQMVKDTLILRGHTALKIAGLYTPAVGLMAIGIASIACSYGIMRKRNLALMAAYNSLKESFDLYRKRVLEDQGTEKDEYYRTGVNKNKTVEIDGVSLPTTDGQIAGTSKFFDEASRYFKRSPEYNLMFLQAQERYANRLLETRGHLFLNEVYDLLDIPRTKTGAMVGWIKKRGCVCQVDFGIFNVASEKARDFVNGYEQAILLNFNPEGVILDQI